MGSSSSAISLSDKKAEIDILAAEYISTVKTLSSDQRVEHLQKIQSAYNKCKEYSDDKVQLAMQTYEMVSWGLLPPCAGKAARKRQVRQRSGWDRAMRLEKVRSGGLLLLGVLVWSSVLCPFSLFCYMYIYVYFDACLYQL